MNFINDAEFLLSGLRTPFFSTLHSSWTVRFMWPLWSNKPCIRPSVTSLSIFIFPCFMFGGLDEPHQGGDLWVRVACSLLRLCYFLQTGARVAQWWEHSPPPSVARVQIASSTPYVSWVCCWFSPLLREFFSGYSGFPLPSKTNISKFQFDQESGRRRTTLWMCCLHANRYLFIYLFTIKSMFLFIAQCCCLLFYFLLVWWLTRRIISTTSHLHFGE